MIINMEEARETLRLDSDDNDIIIEPMVEAIPDYLETTTGSSWESEANNELAKTTAKFLLQLWYDPQGQDTQRLKRTIDSLLYVLTAMAREKNG